jgi:hypothetical protein
MKQTKQKISVDKLKLLCYEGLANAETFEIAIKQNGLTMEIINILRSYYKEDLDSYCLISF